jgi:hypothetical protein
MDRNKIQNPAGQLATPIENKYKETVKLVSENLYDIVLSAIEEFELATIVLFIA